MYDDPWENGWRVTKQDMRDIIKQDFEEYVFYKQADIPGIGDEVDEDYERVVKFAPELLPKSWKIQESDDPVSMKIKNPSNACPPGYIYVEAYYKKDHTYVKGYCKKV